MSGNVRTYRHAHEQANKQASKQTRRLGQVSKYPNVAEHRYGTKHPTDVTTAGVGKMNGQCVQDSLHVGVHRGKQNKKERKKGKPKGERSR